MPPLAAESLPSVLVLLFLSERAAAINAFSDELLD